MNPPAAAWIGLYFVVVAAPLLVLLVADTPPGVEFWWDFSKALGFAAVSMMGVQFALTARFKRLSAPFGIDVIYLAHRYLAWIALGFAAAHFAIIWLLYRDAAGPLDPREAAWYMTAGRLALLSFALAVVTSQWRDRVGLAYGTWRLIHIVLATFGFAAAVAHILGVGYYTATPLNRALWVSMTLSWLLLGLYLRVVKPARQHAHPYRIAEIRDEGADSWTLALEPVGHGGMKRFKPGQFAWLTLGSSPFAVREHPFSLSSTPGQLPRVEMTIRELGDFTGTIGDHKPGEIAYLDGPHGVFSYENTADADGFVFVVGGVGITPVISMLRAMHESGERRPCWLFYANPDLERFLFRKELEDLQDRMNLVMVPVLQDPPPGWEENQATSRGTCSSSTCRMTDVRLFTISSADRRRCCRPCRSTSRGSAFRAITSISRSSTCRRTPCANGVRW